MSDFILKLDNTVQNHEAILKKCFDMVSHFKENPESKIIMDFTNLQFIYPDYALLILCSMKHLENLSIMVEGKLRISQYSNAVNYLASMQFFKFLQVEIPDNLWSRRKNSFVNIQRYNEKNQLEVLESILLMLRTNSVIDENVYTSLDYCFNEILDNVLNHSQVSKGWVVAQYFPNINIIRLMVCDCGIGIHRALEPTYNFSEDEALKNCIKEGITSGTGQGHGLYATSEFIRMNKGWLSIISGNKKLDVSSDNTRINRIPYWQGTCVYLRINTNIDVDYTKFTGKHYDYKEYLYEKMFR